MSKDKRQTKAVKKDSDIVAAIISEFKDKSRAEIRKWRNALKMAEDPTNPRNYVLQDLYENLKADGHFIAQSELRKAATTSRKFSVKDIKTGEVDEGKTKMLQKKWFYNFMEKGLECVTKGYTILELVNSASMDWRLVPRRNVCGRLQRVYLEVGGDKYIDISTGFENNIVRFGEPEDLGIMADICGGLIWKRNAQQSWAEFSERYGMPLISATTNKTDDANVAKVQKMLQALGEAATAVLPEGTSLNIQPFTGGDSFQVYKAQIDALDNEISKAIVGGTMVTDNGSSRSQSEVHERNLDEKLAQADSRLVEFVVNDQLFPILDYWGYGISPKTDYFEFDRGSELTLKEHWVIVNDALQHYEIDQEWVSKTFDIPITGVKENPFQTDNLSENFR
ncbi:MAG: DUF935 family protein [Bacteroidales bacterium]|nr:DUF935 family protein [Bacteroidales bacterium]MBR6438035.1 DUF935 family protein [Bacteroidales bacterium]